MARTAKKTVKKPAKKSAARKGKVKPLDPISLQVIGGALHAIAEQMGNVLYRMSYSSIIRESQDLGAGLFDTRYNTLCESDSTPMHIGSLPGYLRGIEKRIGLKDWKPGSVRVDVAIDQGGCAETSKATTHAEPTYVVDGVIHYCVANMPGGVARTSTYALNNVTLPFALAIANKGWKQALIDDKHLRNGLNVHDGKLTCQPVAEALGMSFVSAESVLGI